MMGLLYVFGGAAFLGLGIALQLAVDRAHERAAAARHLARDDAGVPPRRP